METVELAHPRRCTAVATTTKERCRKWAICGGTVCPSHGGSAPQVKAKARKRLERERWEQALSTGTLGALIEAVRPSAAELDPHAGLLEVVAHTWAMRRALELLVAQLMPGGGDAYAPDDIVEASAGGMLMRFVPSSHAGIIGTDHLGDGRPHVLVSMLGEWSDRHAQACKIAIASGIAEREVRMAEKTAEMIAGVLRAGMASMVERLKAVGVDPAAVSALEAEVPGMLRQALEGARPAPIDVKEA